MAMQPTESVNTALGGVSPPSVLPPAEMGTAQQENPVALFKATSFEVSLT
jgi:hypothetical protein